MIEFLNAKKNELEKYDGDFRSEKTFSENNNSDSASLPAFYAGQADKADSADEFNPGAFLFGKCFGGVKDTMKNVFDSVKSFVFTGTVKMILNTLLRPARKTRERWKT